MTVDRKLLNIPIVIAVLKRFQRHVSHIKADCTTPATQPNPYGEVVVEGVDEPPAVALKDEWERFSAKLTTCLREHGGAAAVRESK